MDCTTATLPDQKGRVEDLTPGDIDDLCEDFREWRSMQDQITLGPHGIEILDDCEAYFSNYEMRSGRFLRTYHQFQYVADENDLRANPWKAVCPEYFDFGCTYGSSYYGHPLVEVWCSHLGELVPRHLWGEVVRLCASHLVDLGYMVTYCDWPGELGTPEIGITMDEYKRREDLVNDWWHFTRWSNIDLHDDDELGWAFTAGITGRRGRCFSFSDFVSEAERTSHARSVEEAGLEVIWVDWPDDGSKPVVGKSWGDFCSEEMDADQQRRRRSRPSERCEFPKDSGAAITNVDPEWAPIDEKEKPEPATMTEIVDGLKKRFAGWPRMACGSLFVVDQSEIKFLDGKDAFFGWLACFGVVQWRQGTTAQADGFVTQSQLYRVWQLKARKYKAVEPLPHEPLLADHYYACEIPAAGDGAALNKLIAFFSPATPQDAGLMRAMFATVFWGGPGGARPAFLVTSDEGRGKGKSKLPEKAIRIAGGSIDVSANEEIEQVKKRLLSSEGLTKRILLLDNVKSLRFSWGELEALVTAPTISGYKNYVGEGSRPNTSTVFITLNGASLSTDMAQRCVIIKVREPDRSGTWEDDVNAFIEANRQAIIADLIGFLRGPRHPLEKFSRWAAWEDQVLRRLPRPVELQALILRRQGEANVENEEAGMIEDHFAGQLAGLGYDPQREEIFIPNKVATGWFCEATGEREKSTSVSRIVKQKANEGAMKRLRLHRLGAAGRGLLWSGELVEPGTKTMLDINQRLRQRELARVKEVKKAELEAEQEHNAESAF